LSGNKDYVDVTVEFLFGLEEGLPLKNRKTNVKIDKPFTVRHLIGVLEKRYPKLKDKIREEGNYVPYLMIVVNGREILPATADNRELSEGDKVVLMYIGVGG